MISTYKVLFDIYDTFDLPVSFSTNRSFKFSQDSRIRGSNSCKFKSEQRG